MKIHVQCLSERSNPAWYSWSKLEVVGLIIICARFWYVNKTGVASALSLDVSGLAHRLNRLIGGSERPVC